MTRQRGEVRMATKRPRLGQRRQVAGLSQEALANALQVERSTVVRWESGETRPQPWLRPRLAGALGVSLNELDGLLARGGREEETADPAEPAGRPAGPPAAGGPGDAPPAAGGAGEAPPVCQLPPAVTDFTGREAEIARLTKVLAGQDGDRIGMPIAVIAGLPGAGKTALALQVAHRVRHAFPDGQLWAPLEGATGRPRDPGEVLGELIRALAVPGAVIPQSLAERASLYRSRLANRRVLVVADDAASAAQVQPLLPGTGQSAVLVTSRSDLAGPPGSRLIQLDPLSPRESVQLLERIVGRERVAAEPDAAAALGEACGQLPLAVRIAGARLAARSSWQLSALARKITRARRLDELQSGDLSVRASLSQAYSALDEPTQCAFRRLALLDSAEFAEWQVAALLGLDDASDAVNRLADSSLLTATGTDAADQPRYRPHDLLRDYAAERLAEESPGEQAAALGRVTDGWLQLAARADAALPREPFFPPPARPPGQAMPEPLAKDITADSVAWFTAERLALQAVIERCCTTGRHQAAAQLASFLASFWHRQGRPDDAERAWQMVTTAAESEGDAAAAARARLRLAAAACAQGQHAHAGPLVDQCVTAFDELGDRRALAGALYWRSVCEWNLGSYAPARVTADRALKLARDADDRQVEFLALRLLALAQAFVPDHADYREIAVTSAEQALAVARQLGEPTYEFDALHTLTHLYNVAGRHQDALLMCADGLGRAPDRTGQTSVAEWLGLRGDALRGLGRHNEAAESLLAAVPIFRDHFMRRHHALCLLKLGYTYQAMGDHRAAARHLQDSMDIFGRLNLAYFTDRAREALLACRDDHGATTA
jgi:tetratricopeptide (TPR) repeat protein/DNA-binding XRE family transcriptional regulator